MEPDARRRTAAMAIAALPEAGADLKAEAGADFEDGGDDREGDEGDEREGGDEDRSGDGLRDRAQPAVEFGAVAHDEPRLFQRPQGLVDAPGVDVQATVSIGGAFAPQWVRSSPLIWVERADRQLYRAKSEGRNRACLEHAAVYQVSAEEKSMLFGSTQLQDSE